MNHANPELDPLSRLILAYARTSERQRYALIFALDSRLADIIRSTSEQLIGQMRLTWWRDILTKPVDARPAGEPLVAVINIVEKQGADMSLLQMLVDGWELLLDDFPWDDRQFDQYARLRGEGFFRFAAGPETTLSNEQRNSGQFWALWDFARHCSDKEMRQFALSRCHRLLATSAPVKFDRNGRPLSILCKLAAQDVKKGELSADLYRPSVAGRIMWHGITGY